MLVLITYTLFLWYKLHCIFSLICGVSNSNNTFQPCFYNVKSNEKVKSHFLNVTSPTLLVDNYRPKSLLWFCIRWWERSAVTRDEETSATEWRTYTAAAAAAAAKFTLTTTFSPMIRELVSPFISLSVCVWVYRRHGVTYQSCTQEHHWLYRAQTDRHTDRPRETQTVCSWEKRYSGSGSRRR